MVSDTTSDMDNQSIQSNERPISEYLSNFSDNSNGSRCKRPTKMKNHEVESLVFICQIDLRYKCSKCRERGHFRKNCLCKVKEDSLKVE